MNTPVNTITYVDCTICDDIFMLVSGTPIRLARPPIKVKVTKSGKCPKHKN